MITSNKDIWHGTKINGWFFCLLLLFSSVKESEVKWASRWDTYLTMSDVQIHWFSIVNSVVVVFFLSGESMVWQILLLTWTLNYTLKMVLASGFVHPFLEAVNWIDSWMKYCDLCLYFFFLGILSMIIIRTLRKDIANYNREDDIVRKYVPDFSIQWNKVSVYLTTIFTPSQEDTMEESGWKNVHGDVFRPPQYPMILSSMLGSGIQLFCMVLIVICESFFLIHVSNLRSLDINWIVNIFSLCVCLTMF